MYWYIASINSINKREVYLRGIGQSLLFIDNYSNLLHSMRTRKQLAIL